MSNNLDTKLEEIVRENLTLFDNTGNHLTDEDFYEAKVTRQVEEYKRAFIDDGWFKPSDAELIQQIMNFRAQAKQHNYVIVDPRDAHVHVCSCGQQATTRFMTGQEWYDKFWKEFGNSANKAAAQADRAARKAAGIE